MDSADKTTMMLIDKGYYDYDFKHFKPKAAPQKARTNAEMANIMARFGFNTKLGDAQTRTDVSAEEMQRIAMGLDDVTHGGSERPKGINNK